MIKLDTTTSFTERYWRGQTSDIPASPDGKPAATYTVTFIDGVAYVPDDADALKAYAARKGWTVTEGVTPPIGWDALVELYRAQDLDALARTAAATL